MTRHVPVVSVSTVIMRNARPPWYTSGRPPAIFVWRSRKIAMPSACTTLSTIVPYRVYWVILRRPSSPSFDNRSRYGQTTVSSCRMIDALM